MVTDSYYRMFLNFADEFNGFADGFILNHLFKYILTNIYLHKYIIKKFKSKNKNHHNYKQ